MVTINDNDLELLLNCIDVTEIDNFSYEELNRLMKIKERTKRAIKRRDEKRAFEEEIKKTATTYQELKEGDLFRITVSKSDLRVFRRDKEGSTQIVDSFGIASNYKSFPYLSMTVYKVERR